MTSKLFFFMPMPLNVELLDAVVLGCKEPVGDVALEPHHLLTDLSHVGNLRGQLQTEADVRTEAWKCRSSATHQLQGLRPEVGV